MSCNVLGEFSSILSILDAAKIAAKSAFRQPTHRFVADMLNLSGLPVFSRGRASKTNGENQEKLSKNEEENADRKKKALRGRFLSIFVFLGSFLGV